MKRILKNTVKPFIISCIFFPVVGDSVCHKKCLTQKGQVMRNFTEELRHCPQRRSIVSVWHVDLSSLGSWGIPQCKGRLWRQRHSKQKETHATFRMKCLSFVSYPTIYFEVAAKIIPIIMDFLLINPINSPVTTAMVTVICSHIFIRAHVPVDHVGFLWKRCSVVAARQFVDWLNSQVKREPISLLRWRSLTFSQVIDASGSDALSALAGSKENWLLPWKHLASLQALCGRSVCCEKTLKVCMTPSCSVKGTLSPCLIYLFCWCLYWFCVDTYMTRHKTYDYGSVCVDIRHLHLLDLYIWHRRVSYVTFLQPV